MSVKKDDFSEVIKRFKEIKIIDCKIANKENELLRLETRVEYAGISTDPFRTQSGDCSAMENKLSSYIDKKKKLQNELDILKKEYSILIKAFETLTKNEKTIIEENLLKGNSLTWISMNILYYSEKQLRRIKKVALDKIYSCLS